MWSRIGNSKVRREIVNRAIRRWSSSALSSLEPSSGGRFAAVWGNGDYGRLGHGNLESQWRPKPVAFSGFKQQRLKSVACGGAHTLFLTESGQVYATGLNDHGQLGISDKMYTTGPVEVSGLPEEIVEISAGYHHSCAITVDGDLYMWGNNLSGQLGLGKKSAEVVPVPTKVECLTGMFVKRAALGSEHSIAVTDEGDALSWGSGGSGRLGHGHQSGFFGFSGSSSEYTPRLIKKLEGLKVQNIAAGLLHSACIDENGSVFLFGEKALQKLGIGGAKNATTPSMIDGLPYSEEVACGGYHTCVVTRDGELYTWGSNENGCLGNGSTDVFHLPERVEGPFVKSPVSKVSCGWKHTAAICDGKVFTWGWGGSQGTFSEDGHSSGGQLRNLVRAVAEFPNAPFPWSCQNVEGHGDDVDYIKPAMVYFDERVKAVLVSCGFNHTGAIFEFTEA